MGSGGRGGDSIGADAKVRRILELIADGVREARAGQVAELLGVNASQVSRLGNDGRVNYELRKGRRWYLMEDVETYARLQAVWASKSGTWTPYGKQDAKEPGGRMVRVGSTGSVGSRYSAGSHTPETGDYRVNSREAARILAVSLTHLLYLARSGQLRAELGKRDAGRLDKRGYPIIRRAYWFSAFEVYALADRREQKESSSGVTPYAWRTRIVKPFIRTILEPPPGDRLVSRQEAAAYLGVPPQRISLLVGQGRLFGWQTNPGKHGCRLYVSERQLARYGNSAERLKRRAARPGTGNRDPSPLGEETEHELWMEENGMADGIRLAVKSNLDRQHGDFLNTRQAAALLGVSKGSINSLRSSGRLAGYQRPRIKRDGGGPKWWFYRRTDLEALLVDSEYLRRRDIGRAAMRDYLRQW
jgi:hypothetical protein